MEPADVVLRFLESVGRRSEAEYYLNLFSAEPKERFACISVDANVARYASESVALHLRFLADLGLFPLVVLGLFEPTDAHEHAERIRRRLERGQVPVRLLPAGETGALAQQVTQLSRTGHVPIVAFGPADGQSVEERFARVGQLLSALQTRKLLFLHRPGGLQQGGALVPIVNLTKEYEPLLKSKELSRKERAILVQSRRLIYELVSHRLSVAITSPLNLFRELFTTKGAGTLLRKGAVVHRVATLQELDRERMRKLITSSFGRAPFEHFFDRVQGPVYLEENYRGAAIVQTTPFGGYLTKFAVEREAQGEGYGRDLWDAMTADHQTLFWRSRAANPVREWYTKICDGLQRSREWTVFWIGLPHEKIPEMIEWTLSQPVDLPPPVPET